MFIADLDTGSFDVARRKLVAAHLQNLRQATERAGETLRDALVADLEAGGMTRATWAYQKQMYPRRGLAYEPAVKISPRSKAGAEILGALETGGTIAPAVRNYLAVPLPQAFAIFGNRRVRNGQSLYVRAVARFGAPRLLPTARGNLLALFPIRITASGRVGAGRRRSRSGAMTIAKTADWAPLFVLARQVTIRARTRARSIIAEAGDRWADAVAGALASAARETGFA